MKPLAPLVLTLASLATAAEPAMETFVFKQVGSLAIKADVWRVPGAARPQPVLVYLHGGSLINGGRHQVEKHPFLDWFARAGFVVVSLDYRLAPESKLPALVEDVEDGFRWVREKGPALFGADPARVAVAGTSAGGYLSLLVGARVKPRPFAVVAEMSYGDLIGAWQMRPSIHRPHYTDSNLSEAEAWRQVSGPPIANVLDRHGDGSAFNDFVRRTMQWPKALTGWDPKTEAGKFRPYLPLRNVTADFPPTFLIHGEIDSDVPREQPEQMAAELARHGVEHRLVLLPHGEHGFRGAAPEDVAAAQHQAEEFVVRHLPPPRAGSATTKSPTP